MEISKQLSQLTFVLSPQCYSNIAQRNFSIISLKGVIDRDQFHISFLDLRFISSSFKTQVVNLTLRLPRISIPFSFIENVVHGFIHNHANATRLPNPLAWRDQVLLHLSSNSSTLCKQPPGKHPNS